MRKCRLRPLLLALVMVLCITPVWAAEPASPPLLPKVREYAGFADVKGAWCETAVKTVYEAGLMDGVSSKKFDPTADFSYAQSMYIAAKLHSLLTGGKGVFSEPKAEEPWYQPARTYLIEAVTKSGGKIPHAFTREQSLTHTPFYDPPEEQDLPISFLNPCERKDFIDILAAALAAANVTLPAINQVEVIPTYGRSTVKTANVFSFYNAGLTSGLNGYGDFYEYRNASSSVNRGVAATFLARIIDPSQRLHFTLKPFSLYSLLGATPEDVLFRINGEDVTAAQGSYLLANQIVSVWQTDYSFTTAEAYTLASFKKVFAYRILAEQRGIALTQEELLEIAEQAKTQEGHRGISPESYLWYQESELLRQKVRASYLAASGAKEDNGICEPLREDLAKAMQEITLERTPLTASKNLGRFRVKLVNTPHYNFRYHPFEEE